HEIAGGSVRELSGEEAVLKLHTKVIYQDVELQQGHDYSLALDPKMRGFVYVLAGEVSVLGEAVRQAESCFIQKHDNVHIVAKMDTRFLLCFGLPHNQPIHQHGTFVD
ncbi:MAG: pirin-like C-terminal cupin domain-containing protein, partial [Gammaproteobacteria bacterium]